MEKSETVIELEHGRHSLNFKYRSQGFSLIQVTLHYDWTSNRQVNTLPVVTADSVSFLWNVRSQLKFKNLNIYVRH